jgi:hypothetical protein
MADPLPPAFRGGGRLKFAGSPGAILDRTPSGGGTALWWRWSGIWFLRTRPGGPAGGVFLAVGLVVAIGVAGKVLIAARHFGRWQYDVILALETAEAILLMLAGSHANSVVSEFQAEGSPAPESRSLIGD